MNFAIFWIKSRLSKNLQFYKNKLQNVRLLSTCRLVASALCGLNWIGQPHRFLPLLACDRSLALTPESWKEDIKLDWAVGALGSSHIKNSVFGPHFEFCRNRSSVQKSCPNCNIFDMILQLFSILIGSNDDAMLRSAEKVNAAMRLCSSEEVVISKAT